MSRNLLASAQALALATWAHWHAVATSPPVVAGQDLGLREALGVRPEPAGAWRDDGLTVTGSFEF